MSLALTFSPLMVRVLTHACLTLSPLKVKVLGPSVNVLGFDLDPNSSKHLNSTTSPTGEFPNFQVPKLILQAVATAAWMLVNMHACVHALMTFSDSANLPSITRSKSNSS